MEHILSVIINIYDGIFMVQLSYFKCQHEKSVSKRLSINYKKKWCATFACTLCNICNMRSSINKFIKQIKSSLT